MLTNYYFYMIKSLTDGKEGKKGNKKTGFKKH
jgi:hypothetical protein